MASTTFTNAVGRRKTAIATVRITPAAKASITVNGRSVDEYFKTPDRVRIVNEAVKIAETAETYAVTSHIEGGGLAAQAEALRHAISRAFTEVEPKTRPALKQAGLLTRDARAKERKKPGLVKARKRKQWSKR